MAFKRREKGGVREAAPTKKQAGKTTCPPEATAGWLTRLAQCPVTLFVAFFCVCVGEVCAVWGFDFALLHNYYLILINDLCNAAIKTWLCARIERLQKVIRLWSPCRWRFIESTNQRGAWVRYVEIGTTGINILLFLMELLFAALSLLLLLLLYPFVSVVYKVYKTLSDCKQYRRFNIARSLTRRYSTWLDDWIPQFHSILPAPSGNFK